MSESTLPSGRIVKVAGPVVDVEFPPDALPEINFALTVELTIRGATETIMCEVAQQLGENQVRAVALAPTDGLVRGAEVTNTGAPVLFPPRAVRIDAPSHGACGCYDDTIRSVRPLPAAYGGAGIPFSGADRP